MAINLLPKKFHPKPKFSFTPQRIHLLAGVLLLLTVLAGGGTLLMDKLSRDELKLSNEAELAQTLGASSYLLSKPVLTCADGKNLVTLSWQKPPGASGFWVQRKLSSSRSWENISSKSTKPSFTDTLIGTHTGTFSYRIRASTKRGISYSNTAQIGVPECTKSQEITQPDPVPTPPQQPIPPTTSQPVTPSQPATPTTPPAVPQNPITSRDIKWGAYIGGWQASDLSSFESKVGSAVDIEAIFLPWGTHGEFPQSMASFLKGSGKTLLIFWDSTAYGTISYNQPTYNYDHIISGTWDEYIKTFAASAKAYGDQVILIPFEEANGNWYPWSGTLNGNTPAKHIAAYRHVRGLFTDVPNVKFGWAMNVVSEPDTPENAIQKYYPGDEYVDYVGIDGFNFNDPWQTFDEIFAKPLAIMKTYNKPIYIFSMACAEGPKKAEWITDALTVQIPKHKEIAGWVWFNENKEKNWLIWSDAASLNAFKTAVQ